MYNKVCGAFSVYCFSYRGDASSFSTFYMCLISLKLCIMNVEISELNWMKINCFGQSDESSILFYCFHFVFEQWTSRSGKQILPKDFNISDKGGTNDGKLSSLHYWSYMYVYEIRKFIINKYSIFITFYWFLEKCDGQKSLIIIIYIMFIFQQKPKLIKI